jgi:D-beta-D-heptose 7-phosphate kinase / D-beta-D-heptose 1-phosphate adenosyltransferase
MNKDLSKKISNLNILVIGDVILDKYISGNVYRISPEAPIPVLNIDKTFNRLGGAANVANNISSMGAKCTLIGKVGVDNDSKLIINLLKEKNINNQLIYSENYNTISKTRVLSSGQQIVRIDNEKIEELSDNEVNEIKKYLEVNKFDIVIVSDYNKGFVNIDIIDFLKNLKIKIIVDPKPENISVFKGVHSITPNYKEASAVFKSDNVINIGRKLVEHLNSSVIITRGKDGVSIFDKYSPDNSIHIPTKSQEVIDVSGAGDTFIAVYSIFIALNFSIKEASEIANTACGIVVSKLGTANVSLSEVLNKINFNDKIINFSDLNDFLMTNSKKIVFTNGCFDIIHKGHIKLLKESKNMGEILIVGLNSDSSIRKLKGDERPINNQSNRVDVLSSISYVDYIVVFDGLTPYELIKKIKPSVLVKGSDYSLDEVVGHDIVKKYNGEIKLVKLINNISTTKLVNKIKKDE